MDDLAGWFSNFEKMQNIAIGALFFYFLIVVLVRILGKRTTSQMNNFDWIINIAVGSLAASGILLSNVAILDATAAILVLATLQWGTTWLVVRSKLVTKLVKAEPTLLTHKGEYLEDAMRRTRVTEEEICSALRNQGITDPAGANWVVLETDGTLSVIPKQDVSLREAETMGNVFTGKAAGDA